MGSPQNYFLKGDKALISTDQDKLGFRAVAKRLASALVNQASDEGLVVGLEGTWGSGKSSLLFLVRDELQKSDNINKPSVIDFKPWLIGNRDALIMGLFGEIAAQLDQIALMQGDATRISISKAREAGEALRKFVGRLSKIGTVLEFAGKTSGLGLVEIAGTGAKSLGEATKQDQPQPQISELKEKLVDTLKKLNHRFIITIDDVDRLEPQEAIEVLRLARSVIDLPNIIYLLCYDSEILAHSIEKATGVKSGCAYLEKIVQLTVMVPRPESFQLRQWFSDELQLIGAAKNDDELSRLKLVIDHEGGRQLRTPRSVARALDAVRFFWPPLREAEGDFADLVWLQLVKDGNPALYRWIEEYCSTMAAISIGTARIEKSEVAQLFGQLLSIVPDKYFEDAMYRHVFSEIIPGIKSSYSSLEPYLKIFQRVEDNERDNAIRNKRLASPDQYRYYFALATPSHALANDDFLSTWTAAEAGPEQLGAALLKLHSAQVTESLSKADILLERIRGESYIVLNQIQRINMLSAISNTMDDAYRLAPFDLHWMNSLWDRAERIVPLLLKDINSQDRVDIVLKIFASGRAIGWLTSLFRSETFSHGRYGDRRLPEDEWLFTDAELNQITECVIKRYQAMSPDEVLASPDPISLLFAWRQGGDELGPRQLMETHIVSDECLVETLEKLTSQIHSSSRGRIEILRKDNIDPFMDYDLVRQRISELENHTEIGQRAKFLSLALNNEKIR